MKEKININTMESGIYVKGVVISSTATAFDKKDKSGITVRVTHEMALQPGIAKWEEFHEPKLGLIEVQDGEVTKFPKLPEFKPVTLKVGKVREFNGTISLSNAELIEESA